MFFKPLTPRKASSRTRTMTDNSRIINLLRKSGVNIGTGVTVVPPFTFDNPAITVSDRVFINSDVLFISEGGVSIGEKSMIGPRCVFCTSTHHVEPDARHSDRIIKPITLGRNVWLGAGVTILPGVTIGDNAVIGAGSLVKDNIPPDCVYAGVPARKIRDII